MGVGGNFWDLLKPYARNEDFDFLRNKKVAVDLSFWIVQNETALKNKARNPHIRLTFFRTINLFSKLGAFPVFVVDGVPSQMKARARIERFYRFSGIDLSGLGIVDEGVAIERNGAFQKCVRECVDLLELLGMPVLKARGEAEALCAQLNREGHVDACITADSDAFLFGANCVIKCLRPNSREPFECYYKADIEAGLGLQRPHLIAISLLVGNDHDLSGVSGIGTETALRFVQLFPEDDILNRLHEVGNGDIPSFKVNTKSVEDCVTSSSTENLVKMKNPHCSYCGHPGNKRDHFKLACEYCRASGNENCTQKPLGFKCECSSCNLDRMSKEQKKQESWQISVCSKISKEKNFPNAEIIDMYLSHDHGNFSDNGSPSLLWNKPNIEMLIDFLWYHQHWDPSFIRQRMLPMLSTIFLRDKASNPTEVLLLHEQYEFHSIQRVKIRYGQPCYLVKWKKAAPVGGSSGYIIQPEQNDSQEEELLEVSESTEVLDEPDIPQIFADDECLFLLTEENMELVRAAFPEVVDRFLQEKEIKESKSRGRKSSSKSVDAHDKSKSPKSSGVQLSITEFYRSTKALVQPKHGEDSGKAPEDQAKGVSTEKRRMSSPNLSKAVRRRLLFD